MTERTARPHDFWLQTCGLDTYRRSAKHARLDTPWNAFTADGRALVCTLWDDLIVRVHDSERGATRSFVKLGGRTSRWKGVGKQHGEQARENLERARAEQRPIVGFEAEAVAPGDEQRVVRHFWLDRGHQLKPLWTQQFSELDARLQLGRAFAAKGQGGDLDDYNRPPIIFELLALPGQVPGAAPPLPAQESDAAADEATELRQEVIGPKNAAALAALALPVLVAHVLCQQDDVLQPLTYLDLAKSIGRHNRHGEPWARGMGRVLDGVTALIASVADQLPERPPFLAGIVVLSSTPDAGLPDKGVEDVWPGYMLLTRREKRDKLRLEYSRVLQYGSRWNDVLRLLGMEPVSAQVGEETPTGGWPGGESAAHKALKRHVRDHPELVGATADFLALEEFALRSGDALDVMFKSDGLWIGVEVKSTVSDRLPGDYERGLYQTVKYRAVMEAQARVDHPGAAPKVQVVLVLEGQLPAQYRATAQQLRVQLLEGVMAESSS